MPAKPQLHVGVCADEVGDGPWIARVVEPSTSVFDVYIVQHLAKRVWSIIEQQYTPRMVVVNCVLRRVAAPLSL